MKLTTNKKRIVILAIIIVVLFLGSLLMNSMSSSTGSYEFGSDSSYRLSQSLDESAMYATPESAASYSNDAYDVSESEQHVIKTGLLDLTVDSIDVAADELTAIATAYEGTVTDKYVYSYGDYKYGTVEIKVAENHFDAAIESIKEIATAVNSENVSAEDVTEQVIDLQARLENAQAEEAAYVSVLNRATTVEDILNVQYYLSNVREEIERYEAQLEYYESRTSYSTITVELTEATTIVLDSDEFQPLQTIKDSVQTVIRLFQGFILGLIELIIVGGAVIIPILILFFGGRKIYQRYKK